MPRFRAFSLHELVKAKGNFLMPGNCPLREKKLKIYTLFSFVEQVFRPNGAYSGQKLMRLVATKMPANTNKTIPSVPVMIPVKYNTATTAAIMTRIRRSIEPIFFFMAR